MINHMSFRLQFEISYKADAIFLFLASKSVNQAAVIS